MKSGLLSLLVLLLVGCAGDLANPERFTDCPPGLVEQMFVAKCANCHGATMPDADLDLVSPGVGDRVRSLTSTSMCEGRALVDSGGGGAHLMVEKVEDDVTCGSRMPLGEQALSEAEIECVRRWVDELAVDP